MNLMKLNYRPYMHGMFRDFENEPAHSETTCNGNVPAVNIREDEKQFSIEMAAPGLKKDDFKINLDNHLLTISKEEKEEKDESNDNYTRREFVYNSFSRSFKLPKTILVDNIKADYKNGVLTVSLPKDEKAKLTREISVN